MSTKIMNVIQGVPYFLGEKVRFYSQCWDIPRERWDMLNEAISEELVGIEGLDISMLEIGQIVLKTAFKMADTPDELQAFQFQAGRMIGRMEQVYAQQRGIRKKTGNG